MGDEPILAGVVGWPIGHSLSPLIHATFANRAGVEGYYTAIPVEPEYKAFAAAMNALRDVGFAGVNVTIPHKEHALRYADDASETAIAVGAANMITFVDGKSLANNSDVAGFQNALSGYLASNSARRSALVLGAGGAARAIIRALKNLGFLEIAIANRTYERARDLGDAFSVGAIDWDAREKALTGADVLVNTTSLGMTGEPPLLLDLSSLKPRGIVADVVYAPLKTDLLARAETVGSVTIDGLSMLMHQAAPAFETWFGAEARVDEDLRAILVAELNRRGKS